MATVFFYKVKTDLKISKSLLTIWTHEWRSIRIISFFWFNFFLHFMKLILLNRSFSVDFGSKLIWMSMRMTRVFTIFIKMYTGSRISILDYNLMRALGKWVIHILCNMSHCMTEVQSLNDFLDNINNGSIIYMIIIVFCRWHFPCFRIRFGV